MAEKKLMFLDHIPVCKGRTDAEKEEFKKDLLNLIVDHTIFKDDQLDVLFFEVKKRNEKIIGDLETEYVINEIRAILDE